MRRAFIPLIIAALGFCSVSLVGCGSPPPVDPEIQQILGPYTATGTLTATGASLYRRGTHVLSVNGRPRFFLESKVLDLNAYENAMVVVEGEMLPNTHPRFQPVLEVAAVRRVEEGSGTQLQRYDVPLLKLTLLAPANWVGVVEGGQLTFRIPDEEQAFIRIEELTMPALPEGLYIRMDGRNGVRTVEEASGVHRVFVRRSLLAGEDEQVVLLFTFAPKGATSATLRDTFYTLLRSVDITDLDIPPDTSSAQPEDPGAQIPCGGSAHVVCPEGLYCDVREIETGIGVCRMMPVGKP